MELPKISLSNNESGGVFSNIKSRLGFSSNEREERGRSYDRGYDDGYDNYDEEYDDYDDGYDDYDEPASQYEPYAPVTTRTTGRSSYSSSPKLVTIDDVKSNTHEQASRVTSDSRSGGSSNRLVVDNTAPAPSSPASTSLQKERSEGLNSLFTPTTPATQGVGNVSSSFGATSASVRRAVKIIRPMSYNDVENVAALLRGGDVVVLSLKVTPENLFNRVLDFSFGVSSALDAHVDCVGPKVFAITTGPAMSDAEKAALKTQGVI